MSQCDPNTILSDGRCFAALPSGLLNVVIAQLWCDVIAEIPNIDPEPGNIQNGRLVLRNQDNGLWYYTSATVDGVLNVPHLTVAPPPPTPETIWIDAPIDGTTHEVSLVNDEGGNPTLFVNDTDSGTAGGPYVLTGPWTLVIKKDSGGYYYMDTV